MGYIIFGIIIFIIIFRQNLMYDKGEEVSIRGRAERA